jgi:hypothetical protein
MPLTDESFGVTRNVRTSAFTAIKNFLKKVEFNSENPGQKPPQEATDDSQSSSGMLGWAFSSITKKVPHTPKFTHLNSHSLTLTHLIHFDGISIDLRR